MPRLPHLGATVALLGLTPLLGSTGCDVSGDLACTLLGCSDQVVVSLFDNGGIPEGTFELVVTIDGDERQCVLTSEGGWPASGSRPSGSCQASFRQASAGDRTVLILDVAFSIASGGVEPEVSIRVQQSGVARADGPAALRLESVTPNGVDCPPTCRLFRARVDLT